MLKKVNEESRFILAARQANRQYATIYILDGMSLSLPYLMTLYVDWTIKYNFSLHMDVLDKRGIPFLHFFLRDGKYNVIRLYFNTK